MPLPALVIVGGAPGTGKTRLANMLAEAIGCPAISRDRMKEGMVLARGGAFRAATDDALTRETFPLFFRVIALLLEGGVTVIAEAAFQDKLWRIGLEPLLPLARPRIIHCRASDDVARRRRRERAQDDATRAAHADADPAVVMPSEFAELSLAAPAIVVDTTDGYMPAFDEIVRFARGG